MEILYRSESGLITIKGRRPDTSLGFLFIVLREAIEPIVLAVGLSLLYSRLQAVLDVVQSDDLGFISALSTDFRVYPMIYVLIIVVLIAWVIYKSWKLKDDRLRDRAFVDALNGIQKTLDEMGRSLKNIEGKNGN